MKMEGSEGSENEPVEFVEKNLEENSRDQKKKNAQEGCDLFDLFMKEVDEPSSKGTHHGKNVTKNNKSKRAKISKLLIEGKIDEAISSSYGNDEFITGTSDEEILRLTSRIFTNSYEVLGIPVDSDDAVIGKRYRKLSLLIHPDKTNHEKAREAFDILNKAYEDLQKAENRVKYKEVWKRAEELVKKENKKNKALKKIKQDQEVFKKEFNKQVIEMSEKLLNDIKERKEYSEKCLLANHRFEQELYRQKLQEEKEKCIQRQKWNEKFEERAQGWRSYKQNNSRIFNNKSSFDND
ncbi:DnaJ domain-containing protein [Cryptosporidium ubiquitum]|uniref:DnaJ domain-containing protein n=1 Tax=Cryptosporidium ubiquitum TaxID=857276 RepID=A0A1J4M9T1_9CRYT|nr:DnaJ domain-containing protein [Cryptosporidium ubiquitum]OII70970.1 DnaJ domain-containing protein [Cryptosporidium ubiquitum]